MARPMSRKRSCGVRGIFLPKTLRSGGRPVRAEGLSAAVMTEQEESELRAHLARLRQEHRDLDAAIEADRKSTRLNSSHRSLSRMPSSA